MTHTPPYRNDALRWVAAEIRFPLIEELAAGVPTEFRDRIRDQLPIQEQQTEVAITVGPAGPSAQQTARHRFLSRDRLMSLTIGRDSIVLETTEYRGWTAFRSVFVEALTALEATGRPDGLLRLGLRYIDEIRVPALIATVADWNGWVDEKLVAPFILDDDTLPTSATIALQYGEPPGYVTMFRAAPFARGRTVQEEGALRTPFQTPEGPYFLLDTDASWVDPERQVPEFTVDRIGEIFDALHEPCKRLFEASITPRLRNEVLSRPREEVWASAS